jgi:maleate cis-trans isomerase
VKREQPAYGGRGRLGLIVPTTNTVNECEWSRVMPDGVSFHTTRIALHDPARTPAEADRFDDEVAAKARELADASVRVVAYACTATSMAVPPERLSRRLSERSGCPVITTAEAIVAALRVFGARRMAIATPYAGRLADSDRDFYGAMGIEVAGIEGLGLTVEDHDRVPATPLDVVRDLATSAARCRPDALLITCTDMPSMALIRRLEAEIDCPVITSNQATLWLALRRAAIGDVIADLGRLFETRSV